MFPSALRNTAVLLGHRLLDGLLLPFEAGDLRGNVGAAKRRYWYSYQQNTNNIVSVRLLLLLRRLCQCGVDAGSFC